MQKYALTHILKIYHFVCTMETVCYSKSNFHDITCMYAGDTTHKPMTPSLGKCRNILETGWGIWVIGQCGGAYNVRM